MLEQPQQYFEKPSRLVHPSQPCEMMRSISLSTSSVNSAKIQHVSRLLQLIKESEATLQHIRQPTSVDLPSTQEAFPVASSGSPSNESDDSSRAGSATLENLLNKLTMGAGIIRTNLQQACNVWNGPGVTKTHITLRSVKKQIEEHLSCGTYTHHLSQSEAQAAQQLIEPVQEIHAIQVLQTLSEQLKQFFSPDAIVSRRNVVRSTSHLTKQLTECMPDIMEQFHFSPCLTESQTLEIEGRSRGTKSDLGAVSDVAAKNPEDVADLWRTKTTWTRIPRMAFDYLEGLAARIETSRISLENISKCLEAESDGYKAIGPKLQKSTTAFWNSAWQTMKSTAPKTPNKCNRRIGATVAGWDVSQQKFNGEPRSGNNYVSNPKGTRHQKDFAVQFRRTSRRGKAIEPPPSVNDTNDVPQDGEVTRVMWHWKRAMTHRDDLSQCRGGEVRESPPHDVKRNRTSLKSVLPESSQSSHGENHTTMGLQEEIQELEQREAELLVRWDTSTLKRLKAIEIVSRDLKGIVQPLEKMQERAADNPNHGGRRCKDIYGLVSGQMGQQTRKSLAKYLKDIEDQIARLEIERAKIHGATVTNHLAV